MNEELIPPSSDGQHTEAATSEEQSKKITFTPEQQAVIDRVVKYAMSRAGKDARIEAERLRKELAARSTTDDAGHRTLAADLAEARSELAAVKREQEAAALDATIRSACAKEDFLDIDLAVEISKRSVRVVDGKPVVIDPATGSEMLDETLSPVTVQGLARRIATDKPFLVRSRVVGGTGASERGNLPMPPTVNLEDLFGKRSKGQLANQLAQRSPREYRRLRSLAQQQGLI